MARLGYQKVEASEAIGALGGKANRKCVMRWFVDAEKISGRGQDRSFCRQDVALFKHSSSQQT